MQNDKFSALFLLQYTTPSLSLQCFFAKTTFYTYVNIVQIEVLSFVEYSGFVNLAQYLLFSVRIFIDFFSKKCILIGDVSFRVKVQTHTRIFRRNT